jgi:acetyl esterase/lipase
MITSTAMSSICRLSGLLVSIALAVNAQTTPRIITTPPLAKEIYLWPDGAPGAKGTTEADEPRILAYPVKGPQKVNTGVVVLPGGGYVNLAMDHEGAQIAAWLNSYGIAAFVLRYRLGPQYRHPIELGDAQRAIRWARAHAEEYGFGKDRLGVWGFSAGGHLASTVSTHYDPGNPSSPDPIDKESCRPDFAILAYPVITMKGPYTHRGSAQNLLGDMPEPTLVKLLSNELHVTKDTPPTFLFHTADDPVVPVQNSIDYFLALRAVGVPAELHIFEHGRHGVGLARGIPELSGWPDLVAQWLKIRGLR